MSEPNDDASVLAGFEAAPSMTFVAQGEQLTVMAVNAAMRAGFPREHMVGRTLREVFPEIAGQRGFELYDRVMETGVPVAHREFRFEVYRGTPEVVEVYVDFSISPLKDDLGRTAGVVCEVRDATERVLERRAAEGRAAR